MEGNLFSGVRLQSLKRALAQSCVSPLGVRRTTKFISHTAISRRSVIAFCKTCGCWNGQEQAYGELSWLCRSQEIQKAIHIKSNQDIAQPIGRRPVILSKKEDKQANESNLVNFSECPEFVSQSYVSLLKEIYTVQGLPQTLRVHSHFGFLLSSS